MRPTKLATQPVDKNYTGFRIEKLANAECLTVASITSEETVALGTDLNPVKNVE